MSNPANSVEFQLQLSPNQDVWHITLSSDNGSPLTAQQVLDSVSEFLWAYLNYDDMPSDTTH